jgi:23S rRNA pseudouridine2605 synthase
MLSFWRSCSVGCLRLAPGKILPTSTIASCRPYHCGHLFSADARDNSSSSNGSVKSNNNNDANDDNDRKNPNYYPGAKPSSAPSWRLSKLLSQAENLTLSRRAAERLIRAGKVTWAGQVMIEPQRMITADDLAALRVQGKPIRVNLRQGEDLLAGGSAPSAGLQLSTPPQVWLVHKLKGELVADHDPQNRPLLMTRLQRAGVGKVHGSGRSRRPQHLKPVGRLDVGTEGLLIVTNDGDYARQMELPTNQLHRTYRVRVHGVLTDSKLSRMQRGLMIENTLYRGMRVHVDTVQRRKATATNQWLTLTCTQGKNRQVRNVLQHLGCTYIHDQQPAHCLQYSSICFSLFLVARLVMSTVKVTRLIRTSYGDYQLQSIPPVRSTVAGGRFVAVVPFSPVFALGQGMAIEVPVKPVTKQSHRGPLWSTKKKTSPSQKDSLEQARPIQWIKQY